MIETLQRDAQRLIRWLTPHRRLLVAFSGGVDSSLVVAAARRAELDLLVAVTADSPSVPRWQLELARNVAKSLEIEHVVIPTGEVARGDYQRNDSRRCFFCKETLYESIDRLARQRFHADSEPIAIASGTNAEDLGDYRPGIQAGRDRGVLTPLADLGFGKQLVRDLARDFGLTNFDLPAAPCLASRIAYGTEVTVERLGRVERAERRLHQLGFQEVRVRLHADDLARIEVAKDSLDRLLALDRDGDLTRELRSMGFRFITVDLEGFQTGSMNRTLVSIDLPHGRNRDAGEACSGKEVVS